MIKIDLIKKSKWIREEGKPDQITAALATSAANAFFFPQKHPCFPKMRGVGR